MVIIKKFHSIVGDKSTNKGTSADDPIALQVGADDKEAAHAPVNEVFRTEKDKPNKDAQPDVKKIEAVTLAWSKKTAFAVLVLYVFASKSQSRKLTQYLLYTESGS